mgnify:CR=1 FL=1
MSPINKDNLVLRATCLNCIDGRVQVPVLDWIKERYKINFVDIITAAGMDGVLASGNNLDEILRNLDISINVNKSSRIFLVGHYDCKGNPVDEKLHRDNINKGVEGLKAHRPELEIIGLWVNSSWQVEVCSK